MESSSEEFAGRKTGVRRGIKRLKLEEDEEEDEQEVTIISGKDIDMVNFKPMSIAINWGKAGFPKLEFLAQLGLDCLAEIDWSITSSPLIKEFISNYDVPKGESKVGGRVIQLNQVMISKTLRVPNRGIRLVARRLKNPDRLKLFKEGSYSVEQGFRNDMASDSSMKQIFSMISEVLQLKTINTTYTSASFLDVLTRAVEGETVNWPQCLADRLRKKLREVKERMLSNKFSNFTGGPWIAHFLKVLSEEEKQVSAAGPAAGESILLGNVAFEVAALAAKEVAAPAWSISGNMSVALEELSSRAKEEECRYLVLKEELEMVRKSEHLLREANNLLLVNKSELRKQNSRLQLEVEAKESEKQDAVREARSRVRQLEETNNEHLLTIAALQTQLQAKSFPYGAHIWEKIQSEAWSQVRAAYPLLVETVDNLIARKVDNL